MLKETVTTTTLHNIVYPQGEHYKEARELATRIRSALTNAGLLDDNHDLSSIDGVWIDFEQGSYTVNSKYAVSSLEEARVGRETVKGVLSDG